jgi:ubiquinone biosynthesis protein
MSSPESASRSRSQRSVDPSKRRVEIAVTLLKYGWDTLIYLLSLSDFVPAGVRQKLAVSSFLRQEFEAGSDELPDLTLPLPSVLRQILEELGPTFVKLGQVLSTRPDLLPPEYIEELSKLQEQVRPAPWIEMEQVLLREWNQRQDGRGAATSVRDIFLEFDTVPLAAGSLGQVYKARKESIGKDYAIKFLKVDDESVRDAVRRPHRHHPERQDRGRRHCRRDGRERTSARESVPRRRLGLIAMRTTSQRPQP